MGLILLFTVPALKAMGSSTKIGLIDFVLAGAILLVLLFKGSSDFSESESAKKYPLYSKYPKENGRFIPNGKRLQVDEKIYST